MKVVKICTSEFKNESRDLRELSVYRNMGADVLVLAKKGESSMGEAEVVDSFVVHRISTRPLGEGAPNVLNRIVSLFSWAKYVKSCEPDIISGHDMWATLIGWISTFGMSKKVKLIYDSHEFELGRNVSRSRFRIALVKWVEGVVIAKSDEMIVVNDSIAKEVMCIYSMSKPPVVVRNIPGKWNPDRGVCEGIRQDIIKDKTANYIVSYHGIVTENRGIENTLRAIASLEDVLFLVVGYADTPMYMQRIKDIVSALGIDDRVVFHPAVHQDELWKYIGASDISIVLINAREDTIKSYYYSLPNKLFESIQAETPVIASKLPEIERIVKEYEVGLTCNPENVSDIVDAINELKNNHDKYKEIKDKVIKAKDELCWEKERIKLEEMYLGLIEE